MLRTHHLLVLLLALAFPLRGAALAQEEADVRVVIAEALAQLAEAGSYTYTGQMDTTLRLTDESGAAFGTLQTYVIDGETRGADFHDTITMTVTPLESEADTQTTMLERVQAGDTLYVRLDDLLAESLSVEPGWWRLDDLLDDLGDDSVRRTGAERLRTLPRPAVLTLEEPMIRSMEALPDETINGVPVRVFAVEMKAVEMALAEQGEAGLAEALESFLENAELVLKSDIHLTYRFYVGVEDGRLYRVENESRSYLPFLEVANSSGPDYNVDTVTSLTFDIDAYEVPVTVAAPADLAD